VPPAVLTEHQYEVLALMLEGNNHHQIAAKLGLTTLAIQIQITDICDRLCDPRNRSYALRLLNALSEGCGDAIGGVMAFKRVKIEQPFQYQGQLYEKADRVRDQQGAYNAVALDGRRELFLDHTVVEAISDE